MAPSRGAGESKKSLLISSMIDLLTDLLTMSWRGAVTRAAGSLYRLHLIPELTPGLYAVDVRGDSDPAGHLYRPGYLSLVPLAAQPRPGPHDWFGGRFGFGRN